MGPSKDVGSSIGELLSRCASYQDRIQVVISLSKGRYELAHRAITESYFEVSFCSDNPMFPVMAGVVPRTLSMSYPSHRCGEHVKGTMDLDPAA